MARDRVQSQAVDNENPAYIRRCRRGLSCFHLSQGYCTCEKNVEAPASFLPLRIFLVNFPGRISGRIRLRFRTPCSVGDNAKAAQVSAVSVSTPERGPGGSVQRIGQGRFAIRFALAFELLLGLPEARDAGRDFGPVTRESFFFLCHRPSVSCFDSRPAIIGARDWGVNAEARMRHCESPAVFEAKAVDKLWRILVAHGFPLARGTNGRFHWQRSI
jgi:hypothetical protein